MFDTVFGLPTHALVVHAVVVLLPLAALAGVLVAVRRPLRRRFGLLVTVFAVGAVAAVIVATQSGQRLQERLAVTFGPADAREAELMQVHTGIGESLLPWAILLAVGLVALMAGSYLLSRHAGRRWLGAAEFVAAAAVVLGAVLSVYWVIRIGDSGARAAWTDVVEAGG